MKGIIIKQNDFGEGHRMLSVFTDEFGIVKAADYGARRTKSRTGASSQFLCFADFDMYRGGDIWTVKAISPIDGFFPIQEDIYKLALCTYFADITYSFVDMYNPDADILRLLLNTLYACAYCDIPLLLMKAVYELRLMTLAGYMPDIGACFGCGCVLQSGYFDFESGGILCPDCRSLNGHEKLYLPGGALKAVGYIISCDLKRIFSFRIGEEGEAALAQAAEKYVLAHIDKNIKSLDYFKKLCGQPGDFK